MLILKVDEQPDGDGDQGLGSVQIRGPEDKGVALSLNSGTTSNGTYWSGPVSLPTPGQYSFFFDMTDNLRARGRKTAKDFYN